MRVLQGNCILTIANWGGVKRTIRPLKESPVNYSRTSEGDDFKGA